MIRPWRLSPGRLCVSTVLIVSFAATSHAGGLLGDAIETLCGNCGAGEALDRAHDEIKGAVPPYRAVEEGGTRVFRETLVETAGPALAQAIRASRNDAAQAGVRSIPLLVRSRLLKWYSAEFLDGVDYRVGQGHELSVQANSFRFGDARAVTLEDIVVFRDPWEAENDDILWAHELAHVQQYQSWGLLDFAKRYVRDYRGVEREAEDVEARYSRRIGLQIKVGIQNNTDRRLIFYLRAGDGRWARYEAEAQSASAYSCDNCGARDFSIQIGTDANTPVSYRLVPDKSYELAWSEDRRRWDVFLRE